MSLPVPCGLLAAMGLVLLSAHAPGAENPGVPIFTNQVREVEQPKPAPAAPKPETKAPADSGLSQVSAPLKEIVRLSKAGVEESVILAFVQSSRNGYHPSAQEVIKLRELGVSPAVIAAVLQRAAETPQPAPPEPQPAPNTPPPAASVPSPSPVVYPTAAYAAAPYSYDYSSPGWYGYAGCYPRYYTGFYPRVGIYAPFDRFRAGLFVPGISLGFNFGGHTRFGHGRW